MGYINYIKKNCKKSNYPWAYYVGAFLGLFFILPILWVEKKVLK